MDLEADVLANKALDAILPLILVSDLTVCGVYHDPAKNKPDEVMFQNEFTWEVVTWKDCPVMMGLRNQAYFVYCDQNSDDQKLIDTLNKVKNDASRFDRDAQYMLDIVKKVSPTVVLAMNNPLTRNYIGSRLRRMFADPLKHFTEVHEQTIREMMSM